MVEIDVEVSNGRTVHVYDTGAENLGVDAPVVFWHHGTPQSGRLPGYVLPEMARRGVRLVSHDRPGYGSSAPQPGRNVAAVASDVALIADALGVGGFAVIGASGGGPHALACAALLGERVRGVACLASVAPFDAPDLDWFAGMAPSGVAEFTAAAQGPAELLAHLSRRSPEDLDEFAPADLPVFAGPLGDWLVTSSTEAISSGYEGAVEDDEALVCSWGFDPSDIRAPVLLVQGGADRFVPSSHADWLAARCPVAELWLTPDDGHISVMTRMEEALGWLIDRCTEARGA